MRAVKKLLLVMLFVGCAVPQTKIMPHQKKNYEMSNVFMRVISEAKSVCGKIPVAFSYKEVPAMLSKGRILLYQTRQYIFIIQCDVSPPKSKKEMVPQKDQI
jgi:hypothetical protein